MIFQRRRRCPVNKSFSKCLWIRLTILNEKEDQFSTLGQKICYSEIVALDAATLRQSLHTGNKRLSTLIHIITAIVESEDLKARSGEGGEEYDAYDPFDIVRTKSALVDRLERCTDVF
ncbi:hypothetical protein Tco_0060914 [Tanacetum coccineum]